MEGKDPLSRLLDAVQAMIDYNDAEDYDPLKHRFVMGELRAALKAARERISIVNIARPTIHREA